MVVQEGGAHIHTEIDRAKSLLLAGDIIPARAFLEELRTRYWHKADAHCRFRILANLGHCANALYDSVRADILFIEAWQQEPANVHALSLAGSAFVRTNQPSRALDVQQRLLSEHPDSPFTWSFFVQMASGTPVEDLERRIPPHLLSDTEVAAALSQYARQRRDFARSLKYSTIAYEANAESFGCCQVHCIALINAVAQDIMAEPTMRVSTENSARLSQAKQIIESQLLSQRSKIVEAIRAELLSMRSIIHGMLSAPESALRDAEEAWRLLPQSDEFACKYALLLVESGNSTRALSILDGVKAPTIRTQHLLAQLLCSRGNTGDFQRALQITESLSNAPDGEFTVSLTMLRTTVLASEGRPQDALRVVMDLASSKRIGPATASVLYSSIHHTAGALDKAKAECLCAFSESHAITDREARRRLASVLYRCELYEESAIILESLIVPGRFQSDLGLLIACALKSGRAEHCMNCLRALRANGIHRIDLLDGELQLLEKYGGLSDGVIVLQSALDACADPAVKRLIRVRLAVVGHRLGRAELVSSDPATLPDLSEVNASTGLGVVLALTYSADTHLAIDYAYGLLRRHGNEPESHRAMIMAFRIGRGEVNLPEHETVSVGCAVFYVENDETIERLVVIEDSQNPSPDPARDEQGPNGPLALLFAGRRVNDVIEPRDGLRYTIRRVIDKRVLRFQQVIDRYESRFPDLFIRRYRIETSAGDLDFSAIIKQVSAQTDAVNNALVIYRDQPVPVGCIAAILGVNLFGLMGTISTRNGFEIKCAIGNEEEAEASLLALKGNPSLILSASAMVTLLHCRDHEWLTKYPGEIYVTESSIHAAEELLREFESPGDRMHLDYRDGRAVLHTLNEAERIQRAEKLKCFISFLRGRCKVTSGATLAQLDGSEQNFLTMACANSGAESIALAYSLNAVLYSDDLAERALASQRLGVAGVWTQGLASWLLMQGQLSEEKWHQLSIQLYALQYGFTRTSAATMLYALDQSGWNSSSELVSALLPAIRDERVDNDQCFLLTATMIRQIWRKAGIPQAAEGVTLRILGSLVQRKAGAQLCRSLIRASDEVFGLDVVSAHRFKVIATSILATNRRNEGDSIVIPAVQK